MRIFKEVMKLKMRSLGLGPDPIGPGSLYEEAIRTQRHTQVIRRGDQDTEAHTGTTTWGQGADGRRHTQETEVSGGASPVHTWVLKVQLDFQTFGVKTKIVAFFHQSRTMTDNNSFLTPGRPFIC